MVKLAPYLLLILRIIAIPVLKNLLPALEESAAKTETPIDDALVGAFKIVIQAAEDPAVFVSK